MKNQQIPNFKFQIISNDQNSNLKFRILNLFGIWCLEFGISGGTDVS